ncbi:MAG TPA: TMEM175 family protein [Xanthobacteraceae bacterium]|jgi:uncharacterized membrane protein|nr:TMEM175 family protein [Xanthobacteraceae bacterium]
MGKGRLEAFTDGVIAIVITIMVLEIKVPQGADFAAFAAGLPILLTYALSFVNVGIFWNNHHHMLHTATRIDGRVLWANLFLLFWMSLVPFVIRWIDEAGFQPLPVSAYGLVLLMSAVAYIVLQSAIVAVSGNESVLAVAIGRDVKGKTSIILYALGMALAFFHPAIAIAIYVAVALLWLVPDRRIEALERQ